MSNPATQSRTESITVLRSDAAKTGTASRIASTNATPPAATNDWARRARLRNFMPNRSPTRCPKLVGQFHLPSTFRAPSEFRTVIGGLHHTPGRDLIQRRPLKAPAPIQAQPIVDQI